MPGGAAASPLHLPPVRADVWLSVTMKAISRMLHIAFAVIALVLVGCQTMPASESAKAEVRGAIQEWVASFNDCSVSRLAALYLPEAVLWGTLSPTLISTPAGVREYFDRACAANPRFKVSVGEQLVRVYGDMGISTGRYIFTREMQGQVLSTPARYSFTFRKVNGQWRIVDHHSSRMPAAPPPAPTSSRYAAVGNMSALTRAGGMLLMSPPGR